RFTRARRSASKVSAGGGVTSWKRQPGSHVAASWLSHRSHRLLASSSTCTSALHVEAPEEDACSPCVAAANASVPESARRAARLPFVAGRSTATGGAAKGPVSVKGRGPKLSPPPPSP